jgi:hypothetical protein
MRPSARCRAQALVGGTLFLDTPHKESVKDVKGVLPPAAASDLLHPLDDH